MICNDITPILFSLIPHVSTLLVTSILSGAVYGAYLGYKASLNAIYYDDKIRLIIIAAIFGCIYGPTFLITAPFALIRGKFLIRYTITFNYRDEDEDEDYDYEDDEDEYDDYVMHFSAEPKQMPLNAYDVLQMGYDDDSAIKDGEFMVDFHDEFTYGRYYRKTTFDKIFPRKRNNPYTNAVISEYTVYQAKV